MKSAQIQEFFTNVINDESFKAEVLRLKEELDAKKLNEQDVQKFVGKVLLPKAKKLGYDFTCEQLLNYGQEAAEMLDDEMLEHITGGMGGFSKLAGIVSLTMMGLNLLSPAISVSAAGNDSHEPTIQIERRVESEVAEKVMELEDLEDNVGAMDELDGKGASNEHKSADALEGAPHVEMSTAAKKDNVFHLDTSVKQLDLFEGDNLNKALYNVLSEIIELTPEDNEGGKYDHFKGVLENTEVKNTLLSVRDCLDSVSLDASAKQVQVALQLKSVEKTLEKAGLQEHYFYGFVSSMRNAYKVLVSRKVADEVLEKYRGDIEKKMGSESVSASVSAHASATATPIDPAHITDVEVGVGFGVNISEGVHEKNFYRTTSGFSFDISAGFEVLGLVSVTANDKVEFSRALIYRSLEQFLDSELSEGKVSSLRVRAPKIKKVAKTRSEMQDREKEALSTVATSIEPYLKILGIISQDTKVALPTITKAQTATKEKTLQNTFGLSGATKKALTDAGLNVSAGAGVNKGVSHTTKRHAYLSLIDENCLPDIGVSADKLAEYLKADEFKKFNEVQELIQGVGSDDVEALTKTITGNLRDYNWSLSVLANENASKDDKSAAKARKRAIEKDWLSTLHTGRLNMLKAGISLAATLRTSRALNDDETTQKSFAELYTQLDTLSKMQTFTKSLRSSKKSAEFSTKHKANFSGASGSVALNIPGAGESSINISYSSTTSDFADDTCQDVTVDIKVPVVGNNIVGQEILREKLSSLQTKLLNSRHHSAVDIGNALKLLNTRFEPSLKALDYGVNSHSSTVGVENYVTLSFYLTKSPSAGESDVALPGEAFSKEPTIPFILKRVKSTERKAIKVSASTGKVGLAASVSVGRIASVIGTHSLNFPANRFNAFALGMQDRTQKKEVSELWTGFKNGQKGQFKEIFKNIAKDAHNIRYELQCMYNSILKGVDSNSKLNPIKRATLKKTINSTFAEFLGSCKAFSDESSDENFTNASAVLDKVLKLNFEHNYMADYNKLHNQLRS